MTSRSSQSAPSSGAPLVLARLGPLDATVMVPGSKSVANRALICAALADGVSTVGNAPDGDDTSAMITCLKALGYDVVTSRSPERSPTEIPVDGRDDQDGQDGQVEVTITGGRLARTATSPLLDAALAGTTSRFVTALAALGTQPITIDGAAPLRKRPFGPLHEALAQIGVDVAPLGAVGGLPVTVTGPPTTGHVRIRGDVSSQFISALMLIGPYLPGGLELELVSPLVSRPYVELTAAVMASFGHEDVNVDDGGGEPNSPTITIRVAAGTYRPTQIMVEPDASSASYPLAMAAVTGGRTTVTGLGSQSGQGDVAFAQLLAAMGCDVEQGATYTTVSRPAGRNLIGIDVDMADISDLVPTLVAVALFATTPTCIRGVGFIRGKESDRLGDLSDEFGRLGANIRVTADGLVVTPSSLHGGTIDPHHDHRLAMAAGVVGAGVAGVTVSDPGVVSKSWPSFWEMRARLKGVGE